jgi:thioredoxin 1
MAGSIRWARSWKEASTRARSSGKLVFIDFYADWCGYCKKLDAETFPDPKVVRAMENYVPVKLNTEREGRTLAGKYGVSSLPTLVIAEPDGAAVATIRGFVDAADMLRALDGVRADRETIARLRPALVSNPADVGAAQRLLRAALRLSDTASLRAAVTTLEKRSPSSIGYAEWGEMGQIAMRRGQTEEARRYYGKALGLSKDGPSRATCRFLIGVTYYKDGNKKEARKHLEAVLSERGCPPEMAQMARNGLKEMGK